MHSMQAQASFGVRRGRPDAIEMLIVVGSSQGADSSGGGLKPGGSAVNTYASESGNYGFGPYKRHV